MEGHPKDTSIKYHHYIYNGFPVFEFHFLTGGWGVELGLGDVDERWGWGRVEGHPKGTTLKFHHYIYNGLYIMNF